MTRLRLAVLLALLVIGFPFGASADGPARYRTDEEDLAWIRSTHPHAGELFDRGEALLFAGDAAQAAELFAQAAEEAPQSALAPRRQCQALTELGNHDEA